MALTLFAEKLYDVLERRPAPVLLILTLMAGGAALEACGIGLVVPYFSLLVGSDAALLPGPLRGLAADHGLRAVLLGVGGILLGVTVLKSAYMAGFHWAKNAYLYGLQARLSTRLFRHRLEGDYAAHLGRHSSEALRIVNSDVFMLFEYVVDPCFLVLTELLVLAALTGVVVCVAPASAVLAGAALAAVCAVFHRFLRARLAGVAEAEKVHQTEMFRWVQQGLGGFKEAKVLGREAFFVSAYERQRTAHAACVARRHTMNELPRLFVEAVFVTGLLGAALAAVAGGTDLPRVLPILVVFVAASVRLMPAANRVLTAVSTIKANLTYLDGIHTALQGAPRPPGPAGPAASPDGGSFVGDIQFDEVEFRYPGASAPALRGFSASIPRGSAAAIVGPSGGGKSTAVDVLLGLLRPQAGSVRVGGRDIQSDLAGWRRRVGFVAQPVYLFDDSVRRNVAFGFGDAEVDDSRVWKALGDAQLEAFVRSLPGGLDARVGEAGSLLSGGQRQRIGIARALYHDPDVLVFDEATTGLDGETAADFRRVVAALKGIKTVVSVMHDLHGLSPEARVLMLVEGRAVAAGSQEELLAGSDLFRALARADRRA